MSIYTDCVGAVYELLTDPSLHSPDHPGFFTDLDVIALASQQADGYDDHEIRAALIQSANVLGKFFKGGKVARFGPVRIPGVRNLDYARIASKIVHADPEHGPGEFVTPNGRFPRMMAQDSGSLMRAGRRVTVNRNDLERWTEEELREWTRAAKLARLRRVPA